MKTKNTEHAITKVEVYPTSLSRNESVKPNDAFQLYSVNIKIEVGGYRDYSFTLYSTGSEIEVRPGNYFQRPITESTIKDLTVIERHIRKVLSKRDPSRCSYYSLDRSYQIDELFAALRLLEPGTLFLSVDSCRAQRDKYRVMEDETRDLAIAKRLEEKRIDQANQ